MLGNQESIENLTKNVNQLLLQGYHPSPLLHSCEEIKTYWPHSPANHYIIVDNHGHICHIYCQMKNICVSGGWMRVAYLNISDSSEECPWFKLYQSGDVRSCERQSPNSGSCKSVKSSKFYYTFIYWKLLFCESGNPGTSGNIEHSKFYIADPLWDGKGCGPFEQICCQAPGLSHGSTKFLTLPLLTTLRCEYVEIKIYLMRMSLLITMRYMLNEYKL